MSLRSSNKFIFFGLLLMLLSASIPGSAQKKDSTTITSPDFDIRRASFLLPQRTQVKKYTHAIYLLYVAPPKDWTLDAVVAPMFNYTGKYELPKGFNLQGGISTLIISNRLNAGPFWNYVTGKSHFSVGYQIAYNYGVLGQFGFNTVLTGFEQQPSLTYGYNFGKTAVTLRGDVYITSSININEGGHTISASESFTNGYSMLVSYEQRLTRRRVMSLGFKLNYLRYNIIAWPALPVSQYRYFMPEFQLGWNFIK